ncbi:hypothetical protein O5161_26770, partial [Escherichia coli]|nr:hypothetical protein [Escherichia coli]
MVKTLTRSPDCPRAAGSLNPAALNDSKAVFECLFVVGYGAFPTKLFIRTVQTQAEKIAQDVLNSSIND